MGLVVYFVSKPDFICNKIEWAHDQGREEDLVAAVRAKLSHTQQAMNRQHLWVPETDDGVVMAIAVANRIGGMKSAPIVQLLAD